MNIKNNFLIPFKYYFYNRIITYFPSHRIRLFYLRNVLKYKIDIKTFVHMACFFEGVDITIGSHTVIGRRCYLGGPIEIGSNVSITAECYMFAPTHLKDSSTFECVYSKIIVKDYVWIGARAMILPGVIIEKGAIVGANSTVTKNIPPCKVYAGSPAKEISSRDEKALKYELNYFPKFN